MVNNVNSIVDNLKRIKKTSPDLIIKKINHAILAYLETTTSLDKINEYILKKRSQKSIGPNKITIEEKDLYYYLVNGYALYIKNNIIEAIETKSDVGRSIENPTSEPSLIGPKDAFTENINNNIGLIKRRIKDENLVVNNYIVGKRTKTIINLLFINDICNKTLVTKINNAIKNINIDGIIDSSDLALLLEENSKTSFPTIQKSERPDIVSKSLLDGKIVIVVDNSCFALILPSFLIDFINPKVDEYTKSSNINFVKILRLFCFFLTIIFPAFYISLINYNQETIPNSLLINFSIQRNDVPFPAVIEAVILIILCEILRESDLRFPNSYGSAISVLGALILGEAAVSAGIVSPIMIIVIAITFISSLIFTEYELVNAIRHYRFIFLASAATLGILGIIFTLVSFLAKISSVKNYSSSYTFPVAPYEKEYLHYTLLKNNSFKRSRLLASKNIIRQRSHK